MLLKELKENTYDYYYGDDESLDDVRDQDRQPGKMSRDSGSGPDFNTVVDRILDDLQQKSVRGDGQSFEYQSPEKIKLRVRRILRDNGFSPQEVFAGVEIVMDELGIE